ncbi:hypothetical protein [Clostridium beijerinckii]|uniref:YcxB-like protein domain-containing protein n=1 Tax=Clostridium beijerinckii TaxID=1520 RepID=A0AAX0AVB9_CLOBE|nr:hypothetical protein [Clostridium beijerinckii]MBA8934194.1 hypothetical protein [Clostridium beijerinckii]NRT72532.1 hypothetical protein [Clostridium beijerinckii]NRT86697.1 hypothetical protein [Clostridium beijerinckii]NRU38388.1 hypothetical protein [Clostridium beijerinckii]NSA98334.1 hypothetical protein [Clostridium beijerinckii]
MDTERPIFSEYNTKRKSVVIIFFVILCMIPIFLLVNWHDIVVIWSVFLVELFLIPITIILTTDHVSLFSDRIETGNAFSKSIILLNEIKGVDIKSFEQSYRWEKWEDLSIIFLNNQNYILLTLPVKFTKRISDIIIAIENNNNKIKISQNLIKYLNENTNYKINNGGKINNSS